LEESRKQVRRSLHGFDPIIQWEAVGEALAVHILLYVVERFARPNCMACKAFASCPKTGSGPCEKFHRDTKAYEAGLALLADAICMLDGVYGLDAEELLAVVSMFLGQIPHG